MMADGDSSEDCVKGEADFEQDKTNNSNDSTIQTNGEHKKMERERVKKKAPGKAVIMSGATTSPPTQQDDMSDAKEYVMQYTDIFASEGDSAVYDDEGGEILQSNDTEIVGHSEENAHYTKDTDNIDDSDDSQSHGGPPPLDSEDDYEYDDSDLGFSPPPMESDGSEGERALSSLQSSPAKSVSSIGRSNENLDNHKEKVSRRESYDSDHGYREGPPPLHSEEENDPSVDPPVENGVRSHSDEEYQENKDELSEEEEQEAPEDNALEDEFEDDEHVDLIQNETRDSNAESADENDSLASDDLPEDEQRILNARSPSEDEQQISPLESSIQSPEPEHTEADESPAHASPTVLSASPEPTQTTQEDNFSESEESEREESSEPLRDDQPEGPPEVVSDPEAPLLLDKPQDVDIQLTPKKNKTSLKEKGNKVEKSALLRSDSSEDEQPLTQERRFNLSDSESETNENVEPVKPVKPVSKTVSRNSDSKPTRTVKNSSSRKEVVTHDVKKKVSSKHAVENKPQKVKEQKTREILNETNEELHIKVSKSTPVAKATEARRKHAPGLAVKDERPKVTKKLLNQQGKHAPGLAVKEETATKIREMKSDDKRTSKDTSMKKQSKETKPKATTTRKDIKHESVVQKKEKNAVGNGEVKKVKQRPKIFKSKYAAVATEDDYEDDEIEDIPEHKPERTRNESRGSHRDIGKLKHESEKKDRHHVVKGNAHEHQTKGHKHERSKHVWLCRDDEIHKLIAQKASLLKEYESGSLAGRNVFSGQKSRHRKDDEDTTRSMPDVGFAGSRSKPRSTRPISEVLPDREPYTSRKRENRRSLQHRYSGSSSEDDDERTNKQAGNLRSEKAASGGTFSVGMASRNLTKRDAASDSEHEETCEYCAAEKAAQKAQDRDLAWEGPHHPRNLLLGVVYTAKYLGSSQIMSPQSPDRNVRMQQAQEAVGRIKVPEGEDQPTTDVDLFISTERIKVVNSLNKDIMMDHALRTVSFIADIGDVLVLMARRPPGNNENVLETKPSATQILASVAKAETDPKMIKITCHVFQAPEAQIIAKSIGQAFNVAYQEFLRTNGISEDSIEDAEYNCVLEAQKILGEDLSLLSDASKSREIVVNKKPGESLGVMIVESGWGSMIPTAIIAHLAKEGPAAKSGRLNVGDQILSVNNTSLVGLPLPECQTIIKNSRPGTKVVMKAVSCPPTVQVVVNRPDTKYQLGFSVQNGMICSLMRGSIAERGGVRVGHRIIEINNESVVATSHQHIVDLLASTTGEIRMKTMPASMYRLLVGLDTPQYI